jgi:hypothetical protein
MVTLCAGFPEGLHDIHCDQRFVLDKRGLCAPLSLGFSMDTRCAAKRKCQGRFPYWRTAGPQAVDQSPARNKRNDRLAEGHERVAGTVTMLRMS